jgi:hypothetical protein
MDANKTKKHLSFFLSEKGDRATNITNVDLMILKDGKVKLICEIEESDIKPIRTYGKIFTVATASMCKLKDNTQYNLDENGVFIQILSSKGLKDSSKKIEQGEKIEKAINSLLQNSSSWLKKYYLIYSVKDRFEEGSQGFIEIEKILKDL